MHCISGKYKWNMEVLGAYHIFYEYPRTMVLTPSTTTGCRWGTNENMKSDGHKLQTHDPLNNNDGTVITQNFYN